MIFTPKNFSKYRIDTDTNEVFRISEDGASKSINTYINGAGYLVASMCDDSGVRIPRDLHRLIGINIIQKPERHANKSFDELQINHKDGNKLNNVCSNLEWVTQSENMLHMYHSGEHCNNSREITLVPENGDFFNAMLFNSMRAAARFLNSSYSSLQWHVNNATNTPFRGYYICYTSEKVKASHIGMWKNKK